MRKDFIATSVLNIAASTSLHLNTKTVNVAQKSMLSRITHV